MMKILMKRLLRNLALVSAGIFVLVTGTDSNLSVILRYLRSGGADDQGGVERLHQNSLNASHVVQ